VKSVLSYTAGRAYIGPDDGHAWPSFYVVDTCWQESSRIARGRPRSLRCPPGFDYCLVSAVSDGQVIHGYHDSAVVWVVMQKNVLCYK